MKHVLALLLLLAVIVVPVSAGEEWTKTLGEEITAVATDEYGDRIFVGTESGKLYCYDSAGSVVWSVQLAAVGADPSILDIRADTEGHIWVRRGNDFYLRNAETGANIWFHENPAVSAEDGDLSNTGIALNAWDGVFDLKIPSTGHTIYRGLVPYNNGAISGDGTWVVVTRQADPNLYLYSVNLPPDDWIAPQGGFGWQNRVSHTIAGTTVALTNYPVEITVIRGAGTSSGSILYAPECRADFNDIRFTSSNGVTKIPYYLKSVVGSNATFLVNIPSIPASPGTAKIYVYWGSQSTITSESDPDAADYPVETLLYDDFNDGVIDGNWTVSLANPTQGAATEAGGYLELYSKPTLAGNLGKVTVTGPNHNIPIRIEVQANTVPTVYPDERVRLFSPGAECPMISKDPDHTTRQLYLSDWTGTAATVGSYITHNIYTNATHTRWVAGSDWDITTPNGATPMQATFITGDREWPYLSSANTVHGTLHLNEITVYGWVGPGSGVEPTHGAWGTVESVVTLLDTETLTGTIVDVDAPETGDWVAVSTTSKTYIIQITDSGFGTIYNDDRTGTAYEVAVADGGSFVIEGRSILADIFRIDATQVGTYTTGGAVQHVDLAQKNGLYAAAGSDDGKYYIFSKDETSAWYLLYASDSYDPVTALAMSWRGEYTVIGRSDGRLTVYQASESDADGVLRITVFKENAPYTNQTLYVEDGGVDQSWGAPAQVITDDYGVAAVPVTWGHYTRITVGDGELVKVIVATSTQTGYVFRVPGAVPLRTGAQFGSSYDSATQRIYLSYDDTRDTTHLVVYEVARVSDGVVVYSENFTVFPVSDYYQIPAGWTNTSYRVSLTASGSPSFTNTWSQWVGTAGVASPPGELDNFMKMGISFFLILFVAGLFSYLSGPQGAVVVSLLAGALVLWGWLPIAPTIVALCIVWAFLGLLGRTAGEG